jgi:hypothetical protein
MGIIAPVPTFSIHTVGVVNRFSKDMETVDSNVPDLCYKYWSNGVKSLLYLHFVLCHLSVCIALIPIVYSFYQYLLTFQNFEKFKTY